MHYLIIYLICDNFLHLRRIEIFDCYACVIINIRVECRELSADFGVLRDCDKKTEDGGR